MCILKKKKKLTWSIQSIYGGRERGKIERKRKGRKDKREGGRDNPENTLFWTPDYKGWGFFSPFLPYVYQLQLLHSSHVAIRGQAGGIFLILLARRPQFSMKFVFLFQTQLMWTSLEFGVCPSLVCSILMTVSASEKRNGPFSEWKLLINKLTVYSFNHFSKVSK